MTLKISFNSQIHRLSKTPASFKALSETVAYLFHDQLPQRWTLQYIDSDGDTIMLSSENDFRNLVEDELQNSNKSVKVLILPLSDLSQSNEPEEFQVIEKRESVKSESKVEVEEEVPVPVSEQKSASGENVQATESVETVSPIQEEKVSQQEEAVTEDIPQVHVQAESSHPRRTMHRAKRILKKLVKTNLSQDKREKLQAKYDKLQADLTAEEKARLEKKKEKFAKKHAQREAKLKSELKDVVTDLVYEQLPVIASLTKEFLQDNSASRPQDSQAPSKVVHEYVSCDSCGVDPIIGVRYKCSVCPNFDFCETCEASVSHPHVFLKIKKPEAFSPFHGRRRVFHCGPFRGGCRREEPRQNQSEEKPFGHGPRGFGHPGGFENLLGSIFGNRAKNGDMNSEKVTEEAKNLYSGFPEDLQKLMKETYGNLPPFLKDTMSQILGGLPEKILNPQKGSAPEETKTEEPKPKNTQPNPTSAAEDQRSQSEETDLKDLLNVVSQTLGLSLEDLMANYRFF